MEPGGIEPPCRDGPLRASTRVAIDLHSVWTLPWQDRFIPRHRCILLSLPGSPYESQPVVFVPTSYGRTARDVLPDLLGSESVVVIGNYFFAYFLRGLHAPRRATRNITRSGETRSAP